MAGPLARRARTVPRNGISSLERNERFLRSRTSSSTSASADATTNPMMPANSVFICTFGPIGSVSARAGPTFTWRYGLRSSLTATSWSATSSAARAASSGEVPVTCRSSSSVRGASWIVTLERSGRQLVHAECRRCRFEHRRADRELGEGQGQLLLRGPVAVLDDHARRLLTDEDAGRRFIGGSRGLAGQVPERGDADGDDEHDDPPAEDGGRDPLEVQAFVHPASSLAVNPVAANAVSDSLRISSTMAQAEPVQQPVVAMEHDRDRHEDGHHGHHRAHAGPCQTLQLPVAGVPTALESAARTT